MRQPVRLVPEAAAASLRAPSRARLAAGEPAEDDAFPRITIYARIPGETRLLAIGPMSAEHPLSGGRGALLVLALVVALLVGSALLLRPMRRRLDSLGRAADALGRGDLRQRVDVGEPDAIGTLAVSFNRMAADIERLVAGREELLHVVSHELRTPLQRMHFALAGLGTPDEAGRARALLRLDRDLDEMENLIGELLTYARLGHDVPASRAAFAAAPFDAAPLVTDLAERLGGQRPGVTLECRVSGPLDVAVEARLVRRALSNLVVNAVRHARSRVVVRAERAGGTLVFEVADDGPGVPPADRERIFEPFRRLAPEDGDERGFGLGLAIVRRIASAHGGTVEVGTAEIGGARFRLVLPAAVRPA